MAVAAISALAAVATAAASGYATTKSLESTQDQLTIAQQGQITDRFGRATEQLGSAALDVRLGGIYSLERLMIDSPPDQPTIMEVLAAYIREHTTAKTHPAKPATDVQAAITVLGRRNHTHDNDRIVDLSGAYLGRADLRRANLGRANLRRANLTYADLDRADLRRANLGAADLTGADLGDADLGDAYLTAAYLTGADLGDANLTGANLRRADLTAAELTGADLSRANLSRADLTDADLSRANLTDAVLDCARTDSATKLPVGISVRAC